MSRTWSHRLRPLGLAMTCLVLLASQAVAQINSTSGNSLTVLISGTEVARFVPAGISSSGVVQVSGSSLTCAASINGALRFNTEVPTAK
jgi:hypothetical protein